MASLSDMVEKFLTMFWDFLRFLLDTLVSFIVIPIQATVENIHQFALDVKWYSPIIAVFIIVLAYVMIRLYVEFDEFLDNMSG